MKKAIYVMNDEDLKFSFEMLSKLEVRERIAPWLLKLLVGKRRSNYTWQAWLSNHWPTRKAPPDKQFSVAWQNEVRNEIDKEIVEMLRNSMKENV